SVEDVESGHPRRHREADREQGPPGLTPLACDGEIPANRRDGETHPQPEMRPPGKPLAEAVEHDPAQRQRAEIETQPVEAARSEEEEDPGHEHRQPRLSGAECAPWKLP